MSQTDAAPAYPASVRDAAHLTGIPVRTIQRWVARGWLRDHGDGLTYTVDLEELIDLTECRPRGRLLSPPTVA